MAVLNLRNVPDDLMRELRSEAALYGQDFHPFCLMLLAMGVSDWKKRWPRAALPSVAVHPPIETMGPAAREAIGALATAAAAHLYDVPNGQPAASVLLTPAAPVASDQDPEIEIT